MNDATPSADEELLAAMARASSTVAGTPARNYLHT